MRYAAGLALATTLAVMSLLATPPGPPENLRSDRPANPISSGRPMAQPDGPVDASPRRMYYRGGTPIPERLEAADRDVLLVQDCCPPSQGAVNGLSHMQFLTRMLDVAAIVRVIRIEPSLNPARDWIDSDVTVEVEEVLKGDSRGPVSGQRLMLRYEEGAGMVGQTRIVARRTWARPIQAGESYLVFLERATKGAFRPLEPTLTFETAGETFRPLLASSSLVVPAATAREEIRLSAALPKPSLGGPQ